MKNEKKEKILIKLNGKVGSIGSKIKGGDIIDITYATLGKDAKLKVVEQIKEFNSISIYINNKLFNIEPIIVVNNHIEKLDYYINEDDDINIILPKTIKEIKEYIIKENVLFRRQ